MSYVLVANFLASQLYINPLWPSVSTFDQNFNFNLRRDPKGDLWVQSPVIIIGNIRSIAENRRRSTEAYRLVMSTWPSMMVGTAEGDLPKLFSPALLA